MDFAVSADHRKKLEDSKQKDRYLDLAKELKKLWNMRGIIISIVTGSFDTVNSGLLKGVENLKVRGKVETILTTTF